MDEARERNVAEQMGIKIMGTIGLLFASYHNGYISSDEIRECVSPSIHSGTKHQMYPSVQPFRRIAKESI